MQTCHLRLRCHADDIDRATASARIFADRMRVDARTRVALNLVVEELISNTLAHGGAAPDSEIEIRMQGGEDGIRLSYVDVGRPFDPTRELPADDRHLPTEQRRLGGLGWVLIRAYCHDLSYRREADRNHIEMTLPLAVGSEPPR